MTLLLRRLAGTVGFCAVLLSATVARAQVPLDAAKTCKNEVGARYLNVPMAYIGVDRGSRTSNGNYLINWTATPPGARGSSGFCVVDSANTVLRFETSEGPGPAPAGVVAPEAAMSACRQEAANRLRTVPLTYIIVQQGINAADGSYMINWRTQPPVGVRQSGVCNVARNGTVRDFRFDNAPGRPPAAGTRQPPGEVQYSGLVRNRNSQKCLDVAFGSTSLGGNVQQYRCQGSANQRWEFVVVGRGEYAIRNVNSGMVLDVTGGSKDNGANVQQYSWNGFPQQRWRLNSASGGTQIISVNSGKCLDVASQGRGDSSNVVQWDCQGGASQRWDIGAR